MADIRGTCLIPRALTTLAVTLLAIVLTALPSPAEEGAKQNRLARETSPYLIKHADNPIDWYPWGPEAFEKAKRENKPVLLSIGYSACHWCNVMEEESFSDPVVGAAMNNTVVSVLVDREERPDLDHLYMTAARMLTETVGWPLNVLLTPDRKPFFAATYIPRETRFGRMGMVDFLSRIDKVWREKREDIERSSSRVVEALHEANTTVAGLDMDISVLKKAYEAVREEYDPEHGGFGRTQKFPRPGNLYFLLRYHQRTGDRKALEMVEHTLLRMRMGGVYDQIGFGFHRYSTDREWFVPHFEKMLYDQALMAMAYTEAYQATGKEIYRHVAEEIFTYMLRDLRAPGGGFYAAEDADSEGVEGKFYYWRVGEVKKAAGWWDARTAARAFGIKEGGNYVDLTGMEDLGQVNILRLKDEGYLHNKGMRRRLGGVREKMLNARSKRVRPFRDEKVLSDWNGLAIAALSRGAKAFGRPEYLSSAMKAADFVLREMHVDGRLWHSWTVKGKGPEARAQDYAFMVSGLIDLYEAGFDLRYLRAALELTEEMNEGYWDMDGGGYFMTRAGDEGLVVRPKETFESSLPSSNSMAMLNLLRLGRLTARISLEQRAARVGRSLGSSAREVPEGHIYLMSAVDFSLGPSTEIVIAGRRGARDTEALLKEVRSVFNPNSVVVLLGDGKERSAVLEYAPYAENMRMMDGKAAAYVCVNYNCSLPTSSPVKLRELLLREGKTVTDLRGRRP